MKDRAGGGGSSSIPAGNNGAAGQECRLWEAGSGRRWSRLFAEGEQDGGEVRGSPSDPEITQVHSRVKGGLCESGTGVFRFKPQT